MRTRPQSRNDSSKEASTDNCTSNAGVLRYLPSIIDTLSESTMIECPICYECPNIEDITAVSECGHQFCYDCIDNWGQMKNSCPLCKSIFTTVVRGSNRTPETKTYGVNKRKRNTTESEQRIAIIRARIDDNNRRQAELQREIENIIEQRNQLRIESEEIRVRIELQRLRLETMQVQSIEFFLQRVEIERLIASIRSEISQFDQTLGLEGGNP
jgi:hypothetical protein